MAPFIVQAITTRYLGPTNTRGSRIKATAAAGSITVSRDCALSIEVNHAKAAESLCRKFGWRGAYYQGALPSDDGYVFVFVDRESPAAFVGEASA